jgi:anti-sigma factor RsiW
MTWTIVGALIGAAIGAATAASPSPDGPSAQACREVEERRRRARFERPWSQAIAGAIIVGSATALVLLMLGIL